MEDVQSQLAALRRRIAQIDRKYEGNGPVAPPPVQRHPDAAASRFIQDLMSGEVVQTPYGEHFETEKLWERHRRHGSVDISDLAGLPHDLLDPLSSGAIPNCC